jgi:hypothetical protein
LAVLFVLNFARLRTNLSCAREQTSSEGHRLLFDMEGGLDTMMHLAGGGGSSTHATDDHETGKSLHECRVQSLRYFLLGGVVLMGYTLLLLLVSRMYKLRYVPHEFSCFCIIFYLLPPCSLLHFAGVDNAMDYKAFLEYSERFPEVRWLVGWLPRPCRLLLSMTDSALHIGRKEGVQQELSTERGRIAQCSPYVVCIICCEPPLRGR